MSAAPRTLVGQRPSLTVADGPVTRRPKVSVVVPAYNEEPIIEASLTTLAAYLNQLADRFECEIVVVNDGSSDRTGELADAFASVYPAARVLHHAENFHLGQSLRYAFNTCTGDYVVCVDCDLSYAPPTIGSLLERITTTKAKVVIASPYLDEGSTQSVPAMRRVLSKGANRFLSGSVGGELRTLTGLVRAYDRVFLASLDLKAMDMAINTEILYKARILNARVEEIPARLDWTFAEEVTGAPRASKSSVGANTRNTLVAGFLLRPARPFVTVGAALLFVALTLTTVGLAIASNRLAIAGAFVLVIAAQALGFALLAFQASRNFEDIFHIGTTLRRDVARLPRGGS